MNPKIKQKWVKALRSGRYRQAEGYLEELGSYCCLGVLCKVGRKDIYKSKEGGEQLLNSDTLNWAQLTNEDQVLLSHMNDGIHKYRGNKKNFKEIADWIEENL